MSARATAAARRWRPLLAGVAALLLAAPAAGVIIDSGDGTGNTTAPPDDPGFDNVGIVGGATAVYLRNGFILTANHVSTGNTILLRGAPYAILTGTRVQISNGDATWADLKVYSITPTPSLPELPIRADTSLPKGEVILVGHGRDRGADTDSNDSYVWDAGATPLPSPPIEGFRWAASRSVRWGTNRVAGSWGALYPGTVTFFTQFDPDTSPSSTAHEAQGANGDSGGPVFAWRAGSWELAGIMLAVSTYADQYVNRSALYENQTGAADLSFYRDEILAVTAVPEPSGGWMLGSGVAFLLALGRRRARP